MARVLNLGILAHVDAGKTSLTERLLHAAGVIDEIGSVDDGNTQTDSLALERQRGITIKSAVVSFRLGDVTVNLIDTPGHPDFIAEVERVLGVLDGAVLVVSAVEGVQAQTRVLMRTLQRLGIPTLIFGNKIDRVGARYESLLSEIAEKLTPTRVAMGEVRGLGTRQADFLPYGAGDAAFTTELTALLAERDDSLLAAYLDDRAVPYRELRQALAVQTGRGWVHPVVLGSAITGAGLEALSEAVTGLLPATEGDAEGPVSGSVFKIERGAGGEKIAYARLFSGTVRARQQLEFGREQGGKVGKVTAVRVFDHGGAVQRDRVTAGRIARIWGLGEVRIGDVIGAPPPRGPQRYFPPPSLETVAVPVRPEDKGALHTALTQLAEQDPLINLRRDDLRGEIFVSLYGEVQKQVIQATLASEFRLEVEFRETTTICVERPTGTGTAVETAPDPFVATVGLRLEPAPTGTGVEFRLGVPVGSVPLAFFTAVEETVRQTLRQGIHGWQVTDCVVTMTHCVRWRDFPSSTAAEHRYLTPLVVMAALERAGTRVHEPVHRFRLEIPADVLGQTLPALVPLGAVPHTRETRGTSCVLEGDVPAAQVHRLRHRLPTLTRGEGVLESTFDHYRPVRGEVPTRRRTDHNPLNRKEYLLRVARRTSTSHEGA